MIKKLTISFCLFCIALTICAAEVVIWATSDMHGNIVNKKGGMVRIASFLEQQRSKDDILIDAGDLFQGSFAANTNNGNIVVNAFNLMNYDVYVPGNHEFEFGKDILRENLRNIKSQILCCNWHFKEPLSNMKPYIVLVRKNFRIGIIGSGERDSKYRILPEQSLIFEDEAATVGRALKELRKERVDLIVLVRHGGIYFHGGSLYSLLKLFPEIDIVIGGHSHELERGRKIAGAYYVQPGKFAEGLSEIRVNFDKNRKIQRITSDYHEVESCTASASMNDILAEEKKIHRSGYRKINFKFSEKLKNITDIQKYLILNSTAHAIPADADIFLVDKCSTEWRGFLNEYLLYRMFPYENKVVTVPVTAKELQIILDECKKYSKKYKVPLISRLNYNNKKHIILRTTSFILSGGGRNFPNSRRIAETKNGEIRQYESLRLTVRKYLKNR